MSTFCQSSSLLTWIHTVVQWLEHLSGVQWQRLRDTNTWSSSSLPSYSGNLPPVNSFHLNSCFSLLHCCVQTPFLQYFGLWFPQPLWERYDAIYHQQENWRMRNWRQFAVTGFSRIEVFERHIISGTFNGVVIRLFKRSFLSSATWETRSLITFSICVTFVLGIEYGPKSLWYSWPNIWRRCCTERGEMISVSIFSKTKWFNTDITLLSQSIFNDYFFFRVWN